MSTARGRDLPCAVGKGVHVVGWRRALALTTRRPAHCATAGSYCLRLPGGRHLEIGRNTPECVQRTYLSSSGMCLFTAMCSAESSPNARERSLLSHTGTSPKSGVNTSTASEYSCVTRYLLLPSYRSDALANSPTQAHYVPLRTSSFSSTVCHMRRQRSASSKSAGTPRFRGAGTRRDWVSDYPSSLPSTDLRYLWPLPHLRASLSELALRNPSLLVVQESADASRSSPARQHGLDRMIQCVLDPPSRSHALHPDLALSFLG